MTYLTQGHIADSGAMKMRVAQAVAGEVNFTVDPDAWTDKYKRLWAAAPGWDAAWEYYEAGHPPTDENPSPPDAGADETVITDGMILSQVQTMLAEQVGGF